MICDDRRHGEAASAATMPNASGKIDGDRGVCERQQVREVAMLEAPVKSVRGCDDSSSSR